MSRLRRVSRRFPRTTTWTLAFVVAIFVLQLGEVMGWWAT